MESQGPSQLYRRIRARDFFARHQNFIGFAQSRHCSPLSLSLHVVVHAALICLHPCLACTDPTTTTLFNSSFHLLLYPVFKMLAADKLQLQSALKQQATALKEKEFNLHHSNLSAFVYCLFCTACCNVCTFLNTSHSHLVSALASPTTTSITSDGWYTSGCACWSRYNHVY